ncbi:amino acid ABC transporter membrane protein 1 (PAAT family) [Melghirimyces profundicolus]|uniref:Amino acid ABC transporter membrane protein 1 (PAAT family) n=1 Tax=Melghirimyces profundicolus TaxID=1242148 RepID=A0A2T6BQW6_9BACL|nr:ectoine/hydroxyectoine ABC transporter permease subunit EhuC [Melghirimyces profundicolus]PTX58468.1 amino acid ABC transporter membrane protein 1 (PAAT family) [Melghirimyces profundicolus]
MTGGEGIPPALWNKATSDFPCTERKDVIPIDVYSRVLPLLLDGFVVTIQLVIFAGFLSFVMSFVGGLARLSRFAPVRWVAGFIIEFFRGTSLLVQLFWLYYALPLLGVTLPTGLVGIVALMLNYGSYGSEIVRSSILAIPKGQTEAAIALNMTPFQRMKSIILPQAFRIMLPSFGNLMIELMKGTALVALITIPDMTYYIKEARNTIGHDTQLFSMLLVAYFIIGIALTMLFRWLERKFSAGRV